MDSNPSRTTTPEDLEHANPYIRLPDHPTSAASPPYHREPIKSLVGIFLCMLFGSSMVALFFSNLESESLSKVNDDRSESSPSVGPKSLMPPSRGVPQGVSEKTFRDFSAAGPVYPWTNAMLSWQRTSYHFQPEKNWMNDPNAIQALQANYQFPNTESIRAVLRHRHRDCDELLGYQATYRYTAPRRGKITDFLRAPSPPPDPTLPDISFIRLTEEQEMAKQSRIRNLLTATSAELPGVTPTTQDAGQSSSPVVALPSPAAARSTQPRRASKRARADPSVELVAELTTEQLTETADPIPPWRPQLKHRGKDIPANASIKDDKEHLLAFDLSKALLLPSDVVGSDHVPDTRLVKSSVKSMARAIQKQHLVLERIHRLRQRATDTASQVEGLQTELGRAKQSFERASAENSRLLGQLKEAEKKRDELQAELTALKESRAKDCEAANNAGFKEAEDSYKKQVFATQDLYFKAGWKEACTQLGQGPETDVFTATPKAFLPVYLVPYANEIFNALQKEAEEELARAAAEEAGEGSSPEPNVENQPGDQERAPPVNNEDDFDSLSPLA